MAEEYVKGRLPQESNPTPGRYPGFVASHDTTGNEDYRPTSPDNPLPTSNYIQRESGVWVPISKDNPMPTQLTGSIVELEVKQKGNLLSKQDLFIETTVPAMSFILESSVHVVGSRLSIGIRTAGREDRFEVRYQPTSSNLDLDSTKENVPIKVEGGYRGLGEVKNLTNECRIYIYNNSDVDMDVEVLTIYDFFN